MEEKDLEQLKKECDEYLNGWKRAKADFINYKKEEGERMSQIAEYVRRELLVRVLPILDSLARAEKEIPEDQKEGRVVKGFLQIGAQWREFLKQQGVEEIETVGKQFSPELHEAVSEEDPPAGGESGTIVEEVEKGYIINGKLLRPSKVKVAK
jgi:molecular chaperone GrpE